MRPVPRRRLVLGSAALALLPRPGGATEPASAPGPEAARFRAFVAGVAREATSQGLPAAIVGPALAGLTPSRRVLALTHTQPELTETWAAYRASHVTAPRVAEGRTLFAADRVLFDAIATEYGVPASVILGIWGLESNYGAFSGHFPVLRALATLGCFGDRPGFFRAELLAALRILADGRVPAARLTGSYAGAMGQPQFLPSTYLRYAVDFDGDGTRDIWTDRTDVLASIANYLRRHGWQPGLPWGLAVGAPAGAGLADGVTHKLATWHALGLRPRGFAWPRGNPPATLYRPDPTSADLFLLFTNFQVIRAYNRSSFYALAVGLLGHQVAG